MQLSECKERLQKILQRLEWTEEGVLRNYNTNSLASKPQQRKTPREVLTSQIPTYPDSCTSNNYLKLDTPELQNLLQNYKLEAPQNFHDLQANFSREQKLRIYEYTIKNTVKLENNTVDKVPEGELSLSDIVAEKKREARCKKRRFRIAKPTQIEEIRALVELQMQSLQQFIQNQQQKEQKQDSYLKAEYGTTKDSRRHSKEMDKEFCETHYKEKRSETCRKEKYHREYKSDKIKSKKHETRYDNPRIASKKSAIETLSREYDKYYERNRSRSPNISGKRQSNRSKSPQSDRKYQKHYERHKRKRSKSADCRKSPHKDDERKRSRTENCDKHFSVEKRERNKYHNKSMKGSEISNYKKHCCSRQGEEKRQKNEDGKDHRCSKSRSTQGHHKKKSKSSRNRSKNEYLKHNERKRENESSKRITIKK